MNNLYYIDNACIPGATAHSIQIEENLKELNKIKKINLISYSQNNGIGFCKHFAFKRPWFFNKIIPLSVFHLIRKINKNLKLDKSDVIFTRNVLIALLFRKKVKKMLLELHEIPRIKENFFHYVFFDFLLFKLPMLLIKKNSNIELIVISQGIKKDLINKDFDSSRISVLPDGVDLKKFDINISKKEARKKLNLPLSKKIVMYTGSFKEWKGYKTLLEASKKLNQDVLVYLIGGSEKEISKLNKKYPSVLFKAFVSHNKIPLYLKTADILVIPNSGKFEISAKHTSPLKLFEYMASKRPIIASDLSSMKEIVSTKEAVFFKSDDVLDLVAKIRMLLNDVKLQDSISKGAFEKSKNYTWERRVKAIYKIILK